MVESAVRFERPLFPFGSAERPGNNQELRTSRNQLSDRFRRLHFFSGRLRRGQPFLTTHNFEVAVVCACATPSQISGPVSE